MSFNYFALPLFFSLLLIIAMAVFTWERQATPGSRQFLWLLLACAIYTFGYAMELSSTNLARSFFWLKFQYFGLAPLPPLLLLFSFSYTGKSRSLSPFLLPVLFFIPALTLFFVLTGSHAFYRSIYWQTEGLFPLLSFTRGPWYWVQNSYMGTAMLISNYLYYMLWKSTTDLYRRQVAIILSGSLIPWVFQAIYLAGGIPFGLDPIPFALTITGLFFSLGLFRYHLFDLVPLARAVLFEQVPDSVLLLDKDNRLLDYNRAAAKCLWLNPAHFGKKVESLLSNRLDLPTLQLHTNSENSYEVRTHSAGTEKPGYFELINFPLEDSHSLQQGQILVLRDITRSKEAELQLNHLVAEQELLLENIDIHVWCLKNRETYGTVNSAHAKFFGLTKKDLEHKAVWEFMPLGNNPEIYIRNNNQVFEEKTQIKSEEWLVNSKGERRLLAITRTPMLDKDGNVEYAICSAVDITEQKQAELQINEYSLELELKGIELESLYRHLHEEMQKARQLHERTLPGSLPQLEGLSLAAHYQPTEQLGGDFYDVIQTERRLIIYLSDVSGHGIDGAMMSFFIKEAINSYVSLKPDELEPQKILEHLYHQYCRENYPDDYFFSIFLAVFDLESKELSYADAGFQNSPLLHLGNGEKLSLVNRGLPITATVPLELLDLEEDRVLLTPGSTVLFATDGIFEQTVDGKQFNEYLADVFYANSNLAPAAIIAAINENFRRFNNGSLQGNDDITLLVLQLEKEK